LQDRRFINCNHQPKSDDMGKNYFNVGIPRVEEDCGSFFRNKARSTICIDYAKEGMVRVD
jgi:hypothetical protein